MLLRNPEITVPNNRVIAEKRAHHLKRKFQQYEKYFIYYEDFVSEIIGRGYARVPYKTPID